MKKMVAFMLSALLAAAPAHAALAAGAAPLPPSRISGFISEETETSITVESDGAEEKTVVLNIGPQTYIVDCASGLPSPLKDRTNDRIVAYYGPAETRSFPPQSNAAVIICNVAEEADVPLFGRVEEIVERTENQVKVMIQNGGLIVAINRETPISPYLTKNIVTIDDIGVGSEILAWCPVILTSYPGQTGSNKTVLLGKAEAEVAVVKAEIPASGTFIENGVTYLPLRAVAEALGYEISWNAEEQSAALVKGEITRTLAIGQKSSGETQLEAAPVIKDNLTYAPVSFFEIYLNASCLVNENSVTVSEME